jgi:sulfur relay (sulfurtransferase) complex TusBCD TusD component (DsrE family)
LIVLDDHSDGSERALDALRLPTALSNGEGVHGRVFLMGDAVAVAGQRMPEGH